MDVREEAKPSTAIHKKKRGKRNAGWIISTIVLVVLGLFIGVWLAGSASKNVKVPTATIQEFAHPIYLPKTLPGNYEIIEDSFSIQEGVLIFRANDGAGGTIVFTEQPRPKELNFEGFYQEQFTDAKTLSDVPFSSVTGKSTANSSNILSIVTDGTWIMASSRSPLSKEDMQVIAETIQLYE